MSLAQGARLGRYEIVRRLGAGAMGEVYLANDPRIDRQVAIKIVRTDRQDAADPHLLQRFEVEARAAGRLVHPHVVTLFDAGEADGLLYLAFEYVAGTDLATRLRQGPPLTLAEVLRIARQATAALAAAHAVGIVHRDVKPANLLLTPDGAVKVADFGIAALATSGTRLTQSGWLLGTPHYLSPEQVRGDLPLDGRSDLFSLGVVLYELLACRSPFGGDTVPTLLYQILTAEPPPLVSLRPDLPPRLVAAVTRLLEKDRDERFSTAEAFDEELAAVERGSADAGLPTDPYTAPSDAWPAGAASLFTPPAGEVALTQAGAEAGSTGWATTTTPAAAAGKGEAVSVRAPSRGGRRIMATVGAALVVTIAVAGGLTIHRWYRGDSERPARLEPNGAADAGQRPADAPMVLPTIAGEETAAAVPLPVPPPAPEPFAPRPQPGAPEESKAVALVGGALVLEVRPAAATATATATIDGLPRGPAASLHTLRPGRHQIRVRAAGYREETLEVESRSEPGLPSRLAVTLRPE